MTGHATTTRVRIYQKTLSESGFKMEVDLDVSTARQAARFLMAEREDELLEAITDAIKLAALPEEIHNA